MKDKFNAKISDFSVSLYLDDTDKEACDQIRLFYGSKTHQAPEIWISSDNICKANDIWSLGLILWEMIFGILPFTLTNKKENIRDEILQKKIEFPSMISKDLEGLLRRLLERDHKKRISIDHVLSSDWLKE